MFWHAGLRALRVIGLSLLLTATQLALADPAQQEHRGCPASGQEEAHWLGDVLFEQGAYQRAGECYQAAGELALANRAFFKAVGPESTATAQRLSDQRDQAKTMLQNIHAAVGARH